MSVLAKSVAPDIAAHNPDDEELTTTLGRLPTSTLHCLLRLAQSYRELDQCDPAAPHPQYPA